MPEKKEVKGYMSVTTQERASVSITEAKGEVQDEPVPFKKGLGAKHPFDMQATEKTVNNIGIINAMADMLVDAIVGDFTVNVENLNGQALVDSFVDESSFVLTMKPWIKEAVTKGQGYQELTDLLDNKIRVLNAKYMFIKRNKKGKIVKINQLVVDQNRMSFKKDDPIPFEPKDIALLQINKTPGEAYGFGLVHPNRVSINNYASSEIDLHKLISRKANSPFHVQVGIEGENTDPGYVDNVKNSLTFMNNSTNWCTDANVKITVLDLKDVGKNLTDTAMHDLEQIAMGMKIPMVMLGVANVPEGLAKAQGERFQRFIQSVRTQVEKVVESQIFKPLLNSNEQDMKVEFKWELPGEDEKNERLRVLGEALKNPFLSPELKAGLEKEYAETLGLQDIVEVLPTPEEAAEQEEIRRKEEEEIQQPEVPGAKPTANQESPVEIKELNEAVGGNTDKVKGHTHTFGANDMGEGQTMRTEPVKHEPAHTHMIKDNKVMEADGHTHKMMTESHECTESCNCELTEKEAGDMTLAEYVNITEIPGFNYSDYLVKILTNLRTAKFSELRALTEIDLLEGLLPEHDIEKLRIVLKDGFRKNKTIKQIETDISNSIDLKDRITINEEGDRKLVLSKEFRPNNIARTETVRLANAGLKDLYTENQVTSYRYLAALDDRTSDICTSLNSQVFLTKDGLPGVNMPPMHPNCRSTIVGIV